MRRTKHALRRSDDSLSDEQAMVLVRDNDDHFAFAQLVDRWEPVLLPVCYRMTGSWADAQEITQEVFARVHAKRTSYSVDAKFSTYIWKIASNLVCDGARRRRSRQTALSRMAQQSSAGTGSPDPHDAASRNEQAARVRWAVSQLPEIYRVVVILRHYENMKLKDLAQALEIPVGTVSSRMSEAYSRLMVLLAEQDSEVRPRKFSDSMSAPFGS